jgi:transcriptional regulator with XRE-family HTH domain
MKKIPESKDRLLNIGHRIAEIRKSKGLTQAQLAEKIGRSVGMIQTWEHKGQVTARTMLLLASALKVDPLEFWKKPKKAISQQGRPKKKPTQ